MERLGVQKAMKACNCAERSIEAAKRDWIVEGYHVNSGRLIKDRRSSQVYCFQCKARWRSKAAYVEALV